MKGNIVNIFLIIFAVYRVSIMVAEQEGPFDIFTKLRDYVFAKAPPYWIIAGVTCTECLSFWLSMPVIMLDTGINKILLWFGVSGIISFLLRLRK